MPNLEAQAAWVPVREIGIELAQGGPNGNMNEQAKALLARTEFLNQQKASKFEIVQGHYEFNTYAEFNAIKSTLPLNCTVIINEMPTGTQTWGQGTNRWNGTTLTKSAYDPLTQAKNYTDESSLDSMRRLTQLSEATDQVISEYHGDSLLGIANNGVGYSVGLDVENNSINYIDFTFGNLQNINSFDFKVFERGMDNYTVMPGSPTDKLLFEKAYTAKEVAQHNIINSSLLYNTVRFNFPALTFTDKQRIIFAVSSDSVFSCEIKAVSPSDTTITDSRGGFYKHATVGWTSFNSGNRRLAYKAGYSDGSNEVIDNVALNETVIDKQLSDNLYFYKRTDVNWTAFGRGFSTHANQKFNKIGLWFANLSDVAKLDYRVIARPIANALDVVWIGATVLDREIYKSSINISGQYDDEQIEHLINFEFNEKLVPADHYVMIIVTASKADGSIATFGSASRNTTSTNRVDQGVYTTDNKDPSFISVGNEIPFTLSFVERVNVVEGVNNLKQIVDSIPKPENTITPIFQPILKAESFVLNVDLTGTVINQVGRQTELINVITHEPTTSGTATVTSTLVKSNYVNWTQNLNPWLGYMNISNVVVTNTDNNAVLTRGTEYDYDSDGGKLIGLTNTTYNVSVSFTYTNSRYDLIQINPFTLDVTMLKGVERGFDPMEWMIEATAPNRPLCRVLVTGNRTEIVPLDEYISCGGKPYVMQSDFLALKAHNDSCLKRVQAKLAKGQNINLIGYGDSITAMGGYHTEDIPNENHDWHGFFATFPQDLRDRIPTYMYDSGVSGGRIKVGWNWKLKEYLEGVHGNTVDYYNFGVSGTNSTDGARDTRMSYPLAYNPDLIVVAFGMNDLGDTALYSNLVKIVNTFKAAGSDVVLMPVVRTPTLPDTLYQIEDWRKVNRLIYSAAIDSGAAYVPIDWYADDEHYG